MNEWWIWHRSHTLACFGRYFRVPHDSFSDLTAGKATVRTFLPRLLTAASRILNCTYRKIITNQTSQSNLPSVFWFQFHWKMFTCDQLIIRLYRFRKWLGTEHAMSHYLNQWWPSLLTYMCHSASLNKTYTVLLCNALFVIHAVKTLI